MKMDRIDKIFLTGASGFVGSNVARRLVEEGRNVALLLREASDTHRISDLLPKCQIIRGTMSRAELFGEELQRYAPNAFVHMAWDGVKGADRDRSNQMDNLMASIKLFELASEIGCKHFIGLGSQAEYGLMSGRISERMPANPVTTYGAAKLATGVVLERCALVMDVRFSWLRLFSSYGPGDDPAWLLPYVINSLLRGQEPSLTLAEQKWDYLHIDDVVSGIIAALDSDASGIFNLGSGQSHVLRNIVNFIRDQINPNLPIGFGKIPYHPNQLMHLEADIALLESASGWRPKVSLSDGLIGLINFYKSEN